MNTMKQDPPPALRRLGPVQGVTPTQAQYRKAVDRAHQASVDVIRRQRIELFKHRSGS